MTESEVAALRRDLERLLKKHTDEKCRFCGSDYWPPAGASLWHNGKCPLSYVQFALKATYGIWTPDLPKAGD